MPGISKMSLKRAASYSSVENSDTLNKIYPWKPGFFRRFPYVGLLSLLLSIACTGAAISIIHLSNGDLVSKWEGRMQPSILLAYTSTVATALMKVAFTCGCTTFFWKQAMRGNMRLTDLYYEWEGATSIKGAFSALAGRRAICISLVSISVTITSLLRGPLMQRASVIKQRPFNRTDSMQLPISLNNIVSDLDDWGGWYRPNSAFVRPVLREYQAKAPMRINGTEAESCNNCSLTVEVYGYDFSNCSSTSYKLDLDSASPNSKGSMTRPLLIFRTSIDDPKTGSEIQIEVTRKVSGTCEDLQFVTTTCWSARSLVTHGMFLNGGNATFMSGNWQDDSFAPPPSYKQTANITATPTINLANWRWAFILNEGMDIWNSYVNQSMPNGELKIKNPPAIYNPDAVVVPLRFGFVPFLYQQEYPEPPAQTEGLKAQDRMCGPAFDDPMDDIINSLRELNLRMSLAETADWNKHAAKTGKPIAKQEVRFTSHQFQTIYTTDTAALILATVVSLLGPLATLILFWGWWKLGREFSMNPLELVNALLIRPPAPTTTMMMTSSKAMSSESTIAITRTTKNTVSDPPFEPHHHNIPLNSPGNQNNREEGRYNQHQDLATMPMLVDNDNDDDESTLTLGDTNSYSAFKNGHQVQVHQTETTHLVQIQNQLATLSLLTTASSNATAKQVVKHIRRRLKAASKNEVQVMDHDNVIEKNGGPEEAHSSSTTICTSREEPTIRYGVLDSTGHLGFAVSDHDGIVYARQPRKGEWL